MDRRQLLRRLGATATAGLVVATAGCGGDETTTTEPRETTTAETPTGTATTEPGTETSTDRSTETTVSSTTTETTAPSTTTQTTVPPTTEATTVPPTTTEQPTVTIQGFAFAPVRLSVRPGTTVTWTNEDDTSHTVVAEDLVGESRDWTFDERLRSGETASYTFDEDGLYEYYCDIHGENRMCGAVLVGDASLDKDLPCE